MRCFLWAQFAPTKIHVVLSRDSDYMGYRSVRTIWRPVGGWNIKKCLIYSKDDILATLEFTDVQLTALACVTKNDYEPNIRGLALVSNFEVMRDLGSCDEHPEPKQKDSQPVVKQYQLKPYTPKQESYWKESQRGRAKKDKGGKTDEKQTKGKKRREKMEDYVKTESKPPIESMNKAQLVSSMKWQHPLRHLKIGTLSANTKRALGDEIVQQQAVNCVKDITNQAFTTKRDAQEFLGYYIEAGGESEIEEDEDDENEDEEDEQDEEDEEDEEDVDDDNNKGSKTDKDAKFKRFYAILLAHVYSRKRLPATAVGRQVQKLISRAHELQVSLPVQRQWPTVYSTDVLLSSVKQQLYVEIKKIFGERQLVVLFWTWNLLRAKLVDLLKADKYFEDQTIIPSQVDTMDWSTTKPSGFLLTQGSIKFNGTLIQVSAFKLHELQAVRYQRLSPDNMPNSLASTLGGTDKFLKEIRHAICSPYDVQSTFGCEPEDITVLTMDLGTEGLVGATVLPPGGADAPRRRKKSRKRRKDPDKGRRRRGRKNCKRSILMLL
ncbi:hypothetical protein EC991_010587 [Linnemannia zychae]|nr:hypothetical protein EC991_010587 [Linnemannia zychae]